jgi:antitoxin CcdA
MRMGLLQRRAHRRGATKATNISLNVALVEEARAFGVNISLAAASGLEQAVSRKRAERWAEENGEALASYNEYVEAHGLPLSSYRLF